MRTVPLYGNESWTISNTTGKKIVSFKMWCIYKNVKTIKIEKLTYEDVLQGAYTGRTLMNILK